MLRYDIEAAFARLARELEGYFLMPLQHAAEAVVERYITWPSLYRDEGGES